MSHSQLKTLSGTTPSSNTINHLSRSPLRANIGYSNSPSTVKQRQREPKDLLKLLLKLIDGRPSAVCSVDALTLVYPKAAVYPARGKTDAQLLIDLDVTVRSGSHRKRETTGRTYIVFPKGKDGYQPSSNHRQCIHISIGYTEHSALN